MAFFKLCGVFFEMSPCLVISCLDKNVFVFSVSLAGKELFLVSLFLSWSRKCIIVVTAIMNEPGNDSFKVFIWSNN